MTLPFRRSSAQRVSSVNETFRGLMPPTVEPGDLLLAHYSGDGNLSAFAASTGDWQGWNLHHSRVVSGTLVSGILYKFSEDGSEAGQTLIGGTSPSEKWCVSTHAIGNIEPLVANGSRFDSNTGSANPDPGAIPSFGVPREAAFFCSLAGEGTTAITAQPSGYSLVHNLNNGAADGVSLGFADKYALLTSENPGAWTRGSAAWTTQAMGWRAPNGFRSARFGRRGFGVLTGTTKDYTVVIPAGLKRRFFAAVHAASAAITSVVLDPGGLNLSLALATNGVVAAETTAPGTARAATLWALDPEDNPPSGTYTLRVSTSVSTSVGMIYATLRNVDQRTLVHDAVVASGTSSTVASASIAGLNHGLVLAVGVQPMTVNPSGGNTLIWDQRPGLQQLSTWTAPHYMTLFAVRTTAGSLTLNLDGAIAAVAESFTAISLKYASEYNAPHYGTF